MNSGSLAGNKFTLNALLWSQGTVRKWRLPYYVGSPPYKNKQVVFDLNPALQLSRAPPILEAASTHTSLLRLVSGVRARLFSAV